MSGPLVGKRRLRAELRRLRRDRELTQDQVAGDMEWSLSKLIRIENGTVAISVSDLRSLLAYYSVHDAERVEDLLNLARAAKKRMWWDEYRNDLPAPLLAFTGFEHEATQIFSWSPILMPGLVQTKAYARAVNTMGDKEPDTAALERNTEFRLRRQREIFGRDDPPHFTAVIEESVLRRLPDRDRGTMREQITRLLELAGRPFMHLHIMPLDAGMNRGWDGSFTIMEFGDEDQVFYSQGNPSGQVLLWEEQDTVARFRAVFSDLVGQALDEEGSVAFMRRVLTDLA